MGDAGTVAGVDATPPVRGLVEGFYGPPWTWDDRAHVMAECHRWGMTHYVYAPKDDPFHRNRWRDPYPASELEALAGLVDLGTLTVGFAISPGLSMTYDDATDRAALGAKVDAVVERGVGLVCLALDDIAPRPGLGPEHARVATWLRHHLDGRADLVLVPTEYTGTRTTPYLDALAVGVPADVLIAWTGTTVVSDHISAADAAARSTALGGRHPLVWDNYPVNDSIMADRLFTGPLRGRAPDLLAGCSGWMANPMVQARASLLALASVAGWLAGDDPEVAWREALGPLTTFAEACDGAEPARLVAVLAAAVGGDRWAPALAAVDRWFRAATVCEAPGLEAEVGPWRDQIRAEASVGQAAVQLVLASRPAVRVDDDGHGRAVGPDRARLGEHALMVATLWPAVRRATVSVLGPRCSVRPVIDQWPDGTWRYRAGAVTEDANALDALVRLALATAADQPDDVVAVVVEVDGRRLDVEADGTFRSPPGRPVTARWGALATTAEPGDERRPDDARLG